MMKTAISYILAGAFLLLLHGELRAQRTSVRERELTLSGATTFSGWGGAVSYGQYTLGGFWMGAIAFHDRTERDVPSSETVHYPRLELRGGYLHRLLSTYSRALSLYGGADAFIGLEMMDLFRTLSPPTLQALRVGGGRDVTFTWGAAPALELEWFAFRSAAFTLGGRMPLTFGSPLPVVAWEVSIGLKLNFK